MINLELLDRLQCCQNGRPLFDHLFGNKTISISEAFEKMPKQDVIWFVIRLIQYGALPKYISNEIPVDFSVNRKSPAMIYLNKNYDKFIQAVISKEESKVLQPLVLTQN